MCCAVLRHILDPGRHGHQQARRALCGALQPLQEPGRVSFGSTLACQAFRVPYLLGCVGGGVLQVDTFTAEPYSPHQITQHNSRYLAAMVKLHLCIECQWRRQDVHKTAGQCAPTSWGYHPQRA
jgi:hypothetical protein